MRVMLGIPALTLSLLPYQSVAHQDVTMNDHARLEVSISSQYFNRFSVEGEGISQVFANGDIVIEQDEVQGQLFIKPVQGTMNQPLYISLVTEKGITQDLTLKPTQKTPQTITLKKDKAVSTKAKKTDQDRTARIMKTALKAALEGRSLEGFISVDSAPLRKFEGVEITSFKLSQGHTLNCEVYEVKNDRDEVLTLSEETIPLDGMKAFVVTKPHLDPKDTAKIVIFSHKEASLPVENAHA